MKWWSNTYGIGMSMSWPQFEPFSEEFRDIVKDARVKRMVSSNDGVTLINQHSINDELPEMNDSVSMNGSVGDGRILAEQRQGDIAVRALYDYEGTEEDELNFKQGDVFEKLEDEDEQGWCKGRKDGQIGLYPANYVEVITK